MEEWARSQTSASLVDFSSKEGDIEAVLKDIAGRAGSKEGFSYSRFFAVGLFRLLELASATDPTVLDKVILFVVGLLIYINSLILCLEEEEMLLVLYPLCSLAMCNCILSDISR